MFVCAATSDATQATGTHLSKNTFNNESKNKTVTVPGCPEGAGRYQYEQQLKILGCTS